MKERFHFFEKSKPEQNVSSAIPLNIQSKTSNESHPYHRTKEIIENRIDRFKEMYANPNLPDVNFEREENQTKIGFKINNETDSFKIITCLLKTLGEMKISTYLSGYTSIVKDDLRISLSENVFAGKEISFTNKKELNDQEIEALLKVYELTNVKTAEAEKSPLQKLAEIGITVYDPKDAPRWDYLAGYSDQKQQIQETVINSILHPEAYRQIAEGTRKIYESNQPKAVLFEGPPGTGKTTMARMIAGQVEIPLIYVPVESIMTKWYGESERNLAKIFDAAGKFDGSIIFLDEIDSLATSRDGNIHEATRRVLSVLLRKIDGFNSAGKTILIGATNRKGDLDPALLSRFDTSINFPLPNQLERQSIFENYAKHLGREELESIAKASENLSGRDIKNLCERAERSWVTKIISGETELKLPPSSQYRSLLQ
jgi:SpoVK/Ycf46/Vps4 family AAA+-type ATPase